MFWIWWYWQMDSMDESWKYPARIMYYSIPFKIRCAWHAVEPVPETVQGLNYL